MGQWLDSPAKNTDGRAEEYSIAGCQQAERLLLKSNEASTVRSRSELQDRRRPTTRKSKTGSRGLAVRVTELSGGTVSLDPEHHSSLSLTKFKGRALQTCGGRAARDPDSTERHRKIYLEFSNPRWLIFSFYRSGGLLCNRIKQVTFTEG